MKYVLVTGGVISGLGKGITTSSLGVLLKECELEISAIKIDPYLNTDAGTMSPFEHGEVYVLNDGGESDLDLGNYERFLDINLTKDHNITTGKIYQHVIMRERRGDYLGKTVQIIPHVSNAVIDWIKRVSGVPVSAAQIKAGSCPDVCLIELGGTVGDIESLVFLDALKQLRFDVGNGNFCHLHVSFVPFIHEGEPKSKPTQHSVEKLRSLGLSPDFIVCRSDKELERKFVEKISSSCLVPINHVICVHNVSDIYAVPSLLLKQNLPSYVLECLRINKVMPLSLDSWDVLVGKQFDSEINVGIVGKYTGLHDSYLSITSAFAHASFALKVKINIEWIDSDKIDEKERFEGVNGILIPGGFGDRGIGGKIHAIKTAREKGIPFLGICLGLQLAVIEYARNVCGIKDATSMEFDRDTVEPVISLIPELSKDNMGGTMCLGSRKIMLQKGSLVSKLYGGNSCEERHRHRYECNEKYIEILEKNGLIFSGKDQTGKRVECVELKDHPFFLATQYHPEFQTRPFRYSPPFYGFAYQCSIGPSRAL
jgi:CTP synthase